ncbi:histidyl-tRNA synthetase [Legionella geestiana]|uniref:Histidine--tRNA ligase n=2 Tax=Legionella geestiana TaxID=45065 RepID=A0A0W0U8S5_9GAMM|nr:histidine--tRNA ligase [Legionella geestiana]KTD04202.1 histidyl-tRNA synthetase [Legionella geestiana]QBS11625.1 histidine--tRNA ligase [Legionella geestiana]STX53693.1 histidyl-tRNA synthetase [Legionella geestiana]
MSDRIQAIRGMNDVLPAQTGAWRWLERTLAESMSQYGYAEIRFPIVESTSLFRRSIGDVTDIVEKEMYSFTDLNGESITLRPEGTAGCVRACLEHGLLHNQQQRLWYMGPMFRHEKPQKGRYRQFCQFGVEAFGIAGVAIELELLALTARLWERLGIREYLSLEVNTIGTLAERYRYRESLVEWFSANRDALDEDSVRRLDKNPMRILDSKNPALRDIISAAPKLQDMLEPESRAHFEALCSGLEALGMNYRVNPHLVRGLDYYGHTVFEWVTDRLGSQATVCAGGRYDALVEHLGGSATPAVGFALGMERLLLLLESCGITHTDERSPLVYLICADGAPQLHALRLAETLRASLDGGGVIVNTGGGSFKSQFKKADRSSARFAVILGEEECASGMVGLKDLREGGEQTSVSESVLAALLLARVAG